MQLLITGLHSTSRFWNSRMFPYKDKWNYNEWLCVYVIWFLWNRVLARIQKLHGCLKLAIVFFKGDQCEYTRITAMNMNFIFEVRHNILPQCHENYIQEKENQLCAWNWHFRKLLPLNIGCPEGGSLMFMVSKWHPDTLQARSMLCVLCV